jgi:protein-S-isoprenylcysteine O-methyltransferase Ste14
MSGPLKSRWVPYVDERVPEGARPFLPTGPDDELTVERVDQFVEYTTTARNTRMQVLAILRTHSSNGAETVLALAALLLAGLAIVVSAFVTIAGFGTVIAVVYAVLALLLCGLLTRPAIASHARKMTALVWLGAYEDAIRDYDAVAK